ncbi:MULTISPECIES: YrhB domain-containing protein [Methylosinus]|uniref:Immunity protein 35 domain-containing protein n=1 Tax=Methylosinus trichosporium (strain ATCC 35070 / NCIMB 11131 / UNIQEM 75 / OB3b) TaxID=595536 RepID=A0A2D2D7G1_METT3|nr:MULTISPECIES: YrhB domain-containing protein [Methylosinus]ATQ70948.1 hypothetical protein CQW49_23660 [Methylosinus trichosporium OB3b]
MTISVDEATSLARDLVRKIGESAGEKLSIMEEKAITIEGGWVFFYNTDEFIRTGDITSALAGNGPVFVSINGEIRELPSAVPWEISVKSI